MSKSINNVLINNCNKKNVNVKCTGLYCISQIIQYLHTEPDDGGLRLKLAALYYVLNV